MGNLLEFIKFLLFKKTSNSAEYKQKFVNGQNKTIMSAAGSLTISQKDNEKKEKMDNKIKDLLKSIDNDPYKLLNCVKKSGTEIYYLPNAKKILSYIGEEEGFIISLKGTKAFLLNLVINIIAKHEISIRFKTDPMFVVDKNDINIFNTLHQFYKWYAYKLKFPGFDFDTQELFKKSMNPKINFKYEALKIDEIFALEEAVKRDKDASLFVLKIIGTIDKAKNSLDKMLATGSAAV